MDSNATETKEQTHTNCPMKAASGNQTHSVAIYGQTLSIQTADLTCG